MLALAPPCTTTTTSTPPAASFAAQSTSGSTATPITHEDSKENKKNLLKVANQCTVDAYECVWIQHDYNKALELLETALDIQRSCLGKHHKDVGYTCNFIGTACFLQETNYRKAMKYFLEARRIFFKCGEGKMLGIDDRINSILLRLRLRGDEIVQYKLAIRKVIEHELQGDRYKELGKPQEAKSEYQAAKKWSLNLAPIM